MAIVGNKTDLIESEQVPYNEAVTFSKVNFYKKLKLFVISKDLGAVFKLTSAKENRGIEVTYSIFMLIKYSFLKNKYIKSLEIIHKFY